MAAKETICNCCCTLMMRLSMPVRNTVLRGDSGQARTTSRRYLRNAISSFMTCGNARAHFGIEYESVDRPLEKRTKPGEWLEYSPLLTVFVSALIVWYLFDFFRTSPQGALAALDLNTYNLMFITAGLLLHWRPKRFVRAVADAVPATGGVLIQFPFYASDAVPATGGVLIQFPFYAVIFGMIVGT